MKVAYAQLMTVYLAPSPDQKGWCAADLWICLICGHVGCGRYRGLHAAAHWQESGHGYALELETQVSCGDGRAGLHSQRSLKAVHLHRWHVFC